VVDQKKVLLRVSIMVNMMIAVELIQLSQQIQKIRIFMSTPIHHFKHRYLHFF